MEEYLDNKGNKVYYDGNIWMSLKEKKLWEQIEKNYHKDLKKFMFGQHKPQPKREDKNVKLSYVYIGGKRKMIGVNNKTLQGYEMTDDGYPTWKLPLIPLSYDKFDRWCTSFDV